MIKKKITYKEFLEARPFIQFPGALIKSPKTKVKVFYLKKWIVKINEVLKELGEGLKEEFPKPDTFTMNEETGEFKDGKLEDFSKWVKSQKPRELEIFEMKIDNFSQSFTLEELSLIESLPVESIEFFEKLGLLVLPEVKKEKATSKKPPKKNS